MRETVAFNCIDWGKSRRFRALSWLCGFVHLCAAAPGVCQESVLGEPQERIIHYEAADGFQDPVALLQERLSRGKAALKFEAGPGYLPGLLKALRVPVSSQGLVFSKTSSQSDHTSLRTPRAVYFSDDVAIGWVPGGPVIDLAAVDPNRGLIFYTLEQRTNLPPRFARRTDCMQCHLGPKTLNVPGWLVRSFYTASNGLPLAKVDGFINGHNSPLRERWGGWYVTGTHAGQLHVGNLFVTDPEHPDQLDLARGANITDLRGRFDAGSYLSRHSDIVALLVLEHQVRMNNLITRANYETRYAQDQETTQRIHGPPAIGDPDWPRQRIARAGEDLLEYMLFRDEAPLNGRIVGTSAFTKEFARRGPRASKGRSLREFDLVKRLFRYPCSFLIYSAAFDALPAEMKSYLWTRLEQILTGKDHSATFAGITSDDRQEVLEILRETKPEFAKWLSQR